MNRRNRLGTSIAVTATGIIVGASQPLATLTDHCEEADATVSCPLREPEPLHIHEGGAPSAPDSDLILRTSGGDSGPGGPSARSRTITPGTGQLEILGSPPATFVRGPLSPPAS